MYPYIFADVFVLPEDPVSFLLVKQGASALVDMIVGVYTASRSDHAPWTDMHIAGAVEDGEFADEEVGFFASCGISFRGNIELAVMDPAMGPADGFF